jgi:hypothetical protein
MSKNFSPVQEKMPASRKKQSGKRPASPANVSKFTPWQGRMNRRRSEVVRLLKFRREHGVQTDDPLGLCLVLADILLVLDQSKRDTKKECDAPSIAELVRRAGGGTIDLDLAASAIHEIEYRRKEMGERYRSVTDIGAGRHLDLTCEERLFCSITTMAAIDETPQERKKRVADARRERDARRSRLARVAKGAKQRGNSAEQTKPWAAEGVSRATYYRKQRERKQGDEIVSSVRLKRPRPSILEEGRNSLTDTVVNSSSRKYQNQIDKSKPKRASAEREQRLKAAAILAKRVAPIGTVLTPMRADLAAHGIELTSEQLYEILGKARSR